MIWRKGGVKQCSFSFSSTHATRHTPHTCQKSCRKGGADQQGDEDRGWETEEQMRRRRWGERRRDGGVRGWRWGLGQKMDGEREGDREKDLGRWGSRGGDVYSRGREERENVGITRHVNETGQAKRAQENNQQSTMITSK